jgi:putative SOS response-associated peptidase YedK
MCYYNGRYVGRSEAIRLKNIERQLDALQYTDKSINGFDYEKWAVIKTFKEGTDWKYAPMEWGFIPQTFANAKLDTREKVTKWRKGYKDPVRGWVKGHTLLNARGDEVLLPGKVFNEAALYRRCLLPTPGFYEARHLPKIGKKGQELKSTETYPYRILPKSGKPWLMACIWNPWTDAETHEYVETFAIVTTEANALMRHIHNTQKRQPTILPNDLAEEWLFGDLSEKRITEIATYQLAPEEMNYYTVQRKFWTLPNADETCDYAELSAITL